MVMTLNLDYWETYSLTAGCNLYATKFHLCVQNVRSVAEQQFVQIYLNNKTGNGVGGSGSPGSNLLGRKTTAMYFHEPDKSLVPTEAFLATAVPKLLITSLIIFLNVVAIITLVRSNKWAKSSFYQHQHQHGHGGGPGSIATISGGVDTGMGAGSGAWLKRRSKFSSHSYYFILPKTTQGLLHSLFFNYLLFGLVTLYSQVSLSVFLLGDNMRLVDDQGTECLVVNCMLLMFSCSIALHLVSLSVDRMLASYLSFKKYTSMSQGTVPLWLLSIWLPSILLGVLPLAGWRKTNFTFCVFVYQFNDDYLRFVAIFFLTAICLIPCLYIYFLIFLRPRQHVISSGVGGGPGSAYNTYNSNAASNTNTIETTRSGEPRVVVYRWYRKLQAHHRLTFSLIVLVNILCWTPFHVYLLLACQSCAYPEWSANGFVLEYIFMLTLTPALVIPLMFSLRSNFMEKCASKIVRCVTFRNDDYYDYGRRKATKNPMSYATHANHNSGVITTPPYHHQKSSLFFIDDFHQQHQLHQHQHHNHNHLQQHQQHLELLHGNSSNASNNGSVTSDFGAGSSQLATPPTSRSNNSLTASAASASNNSTSNIILKSDKETNNNTFFVPHYLPNRDPPAAEIIHEKKSYHHRQRHSHRHSHHHPHQNHHSTLSEQVLANMAKGGNGIIVPVQVHHNYNNTLTTSSQRKKKKKSANSNGTGAAMSNGGGTITNKYKSSFKNKYDSYSINKTLPLRHFVAYLNNGAEFSNEKIVATINDCCGSGNGKGTKSKSSGNDGHPHHHHRHEYSGGSSDYFHSPNNNNRESHNHTYNSLESDMKYGFPIIYKDNDHSVGDYTNTHTNGRDKRKNTNVAKIENQDIGTGGNQNRNLQHHYRANNTSLANKDHEKRQAIYYNSDEDNDDGLRASVGIVRNGNVNNYANGSTTIVSAGGNGNGFGGGGVRNW